MRWGAVAVFVLLLFSGCLGGSSESAGSGLAQTKGTLRGSVTDDEIVPLPGAVVQLKTVRFSPLKLETITRADGSFEFVDVSPGKHTLVVEKSGYEDHVETVTVPAGETLERSIQLRPLPLAWYEIVSLAPLQGTYECALATPGGSGSCDDELEKHTSQDPLLEKNNHTLDVPPVWDGLLVEATWTATQETSQLDGFRIRLEPANATGAYAVAEGTRSPLRIALNRGDVHPGATINETLPALGGPHVLRGLPVGKFEDAGCPNACAGGVGVSLGLRYTLYVTFFFGGPVDDTYSALPE